jgi:hypothetical protein
MNSSQKFSITYIRRPITMNRIENQFLYKTLEKILFNKDRLATLKYSIEKMSTGQISSKDLRYQILIERKQILEKLHEFIPFYKKQSESEDHINQFVATSESSSELTKELHQKNELLEQVATRIDSIYRKLEQKSEK